jgi:uncharacterized protein
MPDYAALDRSSALRYIFYPRRDSTRCPSNAFDLSVPVEKNVWIQTRFHAGHPRWPWIFLFHGNGEVVSDYDAIAPFYNQKGLNIAVADYRGYGMSGGVPTLTDLAHDAPVLVRAATKELAKRGFQRSLWIMGRSLGSISALELASQPEDAIRGVIIESGFTSVVRIIRHLGMPAQDLPLEEIDRDCVEKVKRIVLPTLILHGERDTLVPVKEAEALYQNLGADRKELLVIPSADHNDILFAGFDQYFEAITRFIEATDEEKHETSSSRS